MNIKYFTSNLLICAVLIASSAWAQSAQEAVYGLAQGCYAVQSPRNGQYLRKYKNAGLIDGGWSYRFRSGSLQSATHFFLKPISFGNYFLTDRDGRYLSSHIPAQVSSSKEAKRMAEWRISASGSGGNFTFSLYNNRIKKVLRHNYKRKKLYYVDLFNPRNRNSENRFKLIPQNDCKPFPEITVNVSGDTDALKGYPGDPIRGFSDTHTHITSYEFMGGKMMHGKPFHPWGVAKALGDSKVIHGPNGSLDLIGNLVAFNSANKRYDTRGWPNFPWWPNHKQLSHMGYYYKWMERAYLSGMRFMVTFLVENEVLCKVQKTVNPASWINPNSCNTMDSIRLQAKRMREIEAYIDAQSGGPGKGFFRIVTSPQQARQVIADGKLAVMMGVEASETFNCGLKDNCNRNTVEAGLNEVYNMGIRAVYPAHKFDNQMSGSRVENGFINIGQVVGTGRFFETKECNANTKGAEFTSGFPLIGNVPFIRNILDKVGLNPQYDESIEHCNKYGLSELGVYLINRLIDKKMLIEMDHLSADAATEVMDIVEARNYSGIVSDHSWMNLASDGGLHDNTIRLIKAGGFVARYNHNANDLDEDISMHLDEVEQTLYMESVGFGTDMSGLGKQAAPRNNVDTHPLEYPYTSEFGLVFHKQVSGNRVFDLNKDGLAHYGMVADHIQDIRERASSRVYESIMNSAEAYLQMWERARANTNTNYIDPLEPFVKIMNRRSNRCMDIPGKDNNLSNGTNVQLWSCNDESFDQQWVYNKQSQMFENRADRSKCLDNRGQAYNGGGIVIWDCVNSNNLRWTYAGNKLASKHNSNIVADAYGTKNGNNVGQWSYHGGTNQQWELRPMTAIHTWVDFRDKRSGKCLDVPGSNNANGTKVQLYTCNGTAAQQWYFDPVKGTLRSKLPGNKCLDVPGGNTGNGSRLQIWSCQAGNKNQQFNKNGSRFTPRLNGGRSIDASSTGNGAVVHLWNNHGGDNQKWRAGLN